MGSKTITNPTGAFGVSGLDQTGGNTTFPFVVSTAAIAAKQVVQIDSSGTACRVATTTPSALQLGVALQGGAVGQVVNVAVQGAVGAVPYTGTAPVAGDTLIQSAATAGKVVVNNTPGLGQSIGMAIGAGYSVNAVNVVDVWIGPKYVS